MSQFFVDKRTIAIIGAGPAGIAAAIQLKRYGLEPILYEADLPGGLLPNANLIENYPGFPKGISGTKMVGLLNQQLKSNKIIIKFEKVDVVDFDNDEFRISTGKSEHCYHRVIIASGTVPNEFKMDGLKGLVGRQVFYEVKNLRGIRGKRIAVIGGGDAAFDYALGLSVANTVTIYNRTDRSSCLRLLYERAQIVPSISYKTNHSLTGINLTRSGLELSWHSLKGDINEQHDILLIAIGRSPNLGFVAEPVLSQIEKLERELRIFVIGDVKNGLYRQMGIAVGDGIRAAMTIAEDLTRVIH